MQLQRGVTPSSWLEEAEHTAMGSHELEPGIYKIVNVTSGTVIDLSGADYKSVIGLTTFPTIS